MVPNARREVITDAERAKSWRLDPRVATPGAAAGAWRIAVARAGDDALAPDYFPALQWLQWDAGSLRLFPLAVPLPPLPRTSAAVAAEPLPGSPSASEASGATAEGATQSPVFSRRCRVRGRVLYEPQDLVELGRILAHQRASSRRPCS